MIGGLVIVAVGILNAAALAYIGHRHNRGYDARRETVCRPCERCSVPIYMHRDSDAAHAARVVCSEGQGCDTA